MVGNIVDVMRKLSISKDLELKTISKSFPVWKEKMMKVMGNHVTVDGLVELGDHLAEVFKSTSRPGREQGTVSGGGTAWEALMCWYCNIRLLGNRTVVMRWRKDMVPRPIFDALTVMYGSFASTSESDLIAITFPKREEYLQPDRSIFNPKGDEVSEKKLKERLDQLASSHFTEYGVGIIQLKTNWNDSAQVPMLWDLIYRVKDFKDHNIHVGTSSWSISALKKFSYSFATVPTSRGPYSINQVRVQRVSKLTGGNYWGMPTMSGVASSVKDMIQNNFSDGINVDLRTDLERELPHLKEKYEYFGLV